MFDYFKGRIASLSPTHATIDCGGVGYYLHITLFTYTALKEKPEGLLYVHQQVKEDALVLFGFINESERTAFRDLISVNGVGASTARVILSSIIYTDVVQIIAGGNLLALQKIKGIGQKTAQRILVELQDKMRKIPADGNSISGGEQPSVKNEALSALTTLGFARAAAEKAIVQASKNESALLSVESLIKEALSYL